MRRQARPRRRGMLVRSGALIAALLLPAFAGAHAIHTTMTELTVDDRGATFRIRAFADDFSLSVARAAGRAAPADSSAPERDVVQYVRQRFVVTLGSTAATLTPCGIRRAADLYWLCFRVERPQGGALRIRNAMLTELHADQVNIVQVLGSATRRTMLFTAKSTPALLQ